MSDESRQVLGAWVFIGIGMLVMALGVWLARSVRRAKQWPSVSGTILRSQVLRDDVRGPDRQGDTYYELDVEYEYEVEGRRYVGTGYRLSGNELYDEGAEELLKYAAGAVVPVYYDPRYPQSPVLEIREPPGKAGCMFLVGLLFAGIGLVALLTAGR